MQIMDDAEIDWPECTPRFDSSYLYNYKGPNYSFGDCGSAYSRYIFVVFKLICECIFLNLFIGLGPTLACIRCVDAQPRLGCNMR
jgi:hypothetical protein